MTRLEGDITIERPVEEVFDFVADAANEPQYNPRVTRAEKVTSGNVGVGTRFKSAMKVPGAAAEMTIEFAEFERPRHIAATAHLLNIDSVGQLEFEPVPLLNMDSLGRLESAPVSVGTKLHWVWDRQPHGVMRLLYPFLRRLDARQERETWASLKRLLEATPAGS